MALDFQANQTTLAYVGMVQLKLEEARAEIKELQRTNAELAGTVKRLSGELEAAKAAGYVPEQPAEAAKAD